MPHSTAWARGPRSGIGGRLLEALIASTEAADVWTINAGMFPENEAQIWGKAAWRGVADVGVSRTPHGTRTGEARFMLTIPSA